MSPAAAAAAAATAAAAAYVAIRDETRLSRARPRDYPVAALRNNVTGADAANVDVDAAITSGQRVSIR